MVNLFVSANYKLLGKEINLWLRQRKGIYCWIWKSRGIVFKSMVCYQVVVVRHKSNARTGNDIRVWAHRDLEFGVQSRPTPRGRNEPVCRQSGQTRGLLFLHHHPPAGRRAALVLDQDPGIHCSSSNGVYLLFHVILFASSMACRSLIYINVDFCSTGLPGYSMLTPNQTTSWSRFHNS